MLRRFALFLAILAMIGVIAGLILVKVPYRNINENRLYLAGQYHIQDIPAGTHVVGYVNGENFSVYILNGENLRLFREGKPFRASYKWEKVNHIEFNFNASERLYIVIRNEKNKVQTIKLVLKARRL